MASVLVPLTSDSIYDRVIGKIYHEQRDPALSMGFVLLSSF